MIAYSILKLFLNPLFGILLCKRHLTAFESGPLCTAGTGLLSFMSFTGSLSVAGTYAPSHSLAFFPASSAGFKSSNFMIPPETLLQPFLSVS